MQLLRVYKTQSVFTACLKHTPDYKNVITSVIKDKPARPYFLPIHHLINSSRRFIPSAVWPLQVSGPVSALKGCDSSRQTEPVSRTLSFLLHDLSRDEITRDAAIPISELCGRVAECLELSKQDHIEMLLVPKEGTLSCRNNIDGKHSLCDFPLMTSPGTGKTRSSWVRKVEKQTSNCVSLQLG